MKRLLEYIADREHSPVSKVILARIALMAGGGHVRVNTMAFAREHGYTSNSVRSALRELSDSRVIGRVKLSAGTYNVVVLHDTPS